MKEKTTAQPSAGWKEKLRGSAVAKVYLTTVLLYVVTCILQPNYFSGKYISDTLVTASFLGVLAIGQPLVILPGGIDLSIIVTFNLAAVITTSMQNDNQLLLIAVLLGVSILIGLINGLGVVFLDVPPIVMTLAMQSILWSVVYLYTNGLANGAAPDWLRFLSTESVFGVRLILILWVVIAAGITFALTKTNFGRKLYALGNSRSVAYYSGVNNSAVLILVYILSAVFASLGGLLFTGYLGYAYIGMGTPYLMPSIAAVVIGGTSILGGKGNYAGTVAGAIILYILNGLLVNLDMQEGGRNIIYGVIILAVLFLYGRAKKEG